MCKSSYIYPYKDGVQNSASASKLEKNLSVPYPLLGIQNPQFESPIWGTYAELRNVIAGRIAVKVNEKYYRVPTLSETSSIRVVMYINSDQILYG